MEAEFIITMLDLLPNHMWVGAVNSLTETDQATPEELDKVVEVLIMRRAEKIAKERITSNPELMKQHEFMVKQVKQYQAQQEQKAGDDLIAKANAIINKKKDKKDE